MFCGSAPINANTRKIVRMNKFLKTTLLLVAVVIATSLVISSCGEGVDNSPEVTILEVHKDTCVVDFDSTFTEESLINYMEELNMAFPHIVLAQAKLETGNFTSKVFKDNNNLFGMKRAGKRPSTVKHISRGHGRYMHWKESVLDYALRQAYYRAHSMKSDEEYYQHLIQSGYARDVNYISKIRKIVNSK